MTSKRLLFALLLSLAPAAGQSAEPQSLFFTPAERQTVERAIQNRPRDDAAKARHLLHLSSLLYFGPERWSVWVQGQRLTHETPAANGFKILQVSPEGVSLEAVLANGTRRIATLRTHQSLNLLTGEIVEGY